jgi:P4 family phage/plasmid primase-like protien
MLRYWREEWWQWNGKSYFQRSTGDVLNLLDRTTEDEFDRINIEAQAAGGDEERPVTAIKVTRSLKGNILSALEGLCGLDSTTQFPTWLDGRTQARNCIALQNGILHIDRLLSPDAHDSEILTPHTPQWFSPVCLPYEFNPSAECPTWLALMDHNMEGDQERLAILQEWYGYNLIPDSSYQRFLVCEGDGGNGKSVYCAVLEAMLGEANVIHVQLENFGDRFSLSSTLGKLANISADVGEIEKAAEGIIKAFISGDRMQFDRKNKAPIESTPTARITIAANTRPRFNDRSTGIWRRMIPIPFRIKISDKLRVNGMDTIKWWEQTGELPGILNWALAGLHRLRSQGRFTYSTVSEAMLEDYCLDSNPARAFLKEFCGFNRSEQVSSMELYDTYKRWCVKSNYRPLSEKSFGKEVFRVYPTIEKRRLGPEGDRFYCYCGLALTDRF